MSDQIDVTLLHNQRCSTSRAAKEIVGESSRTVRVVNYLSEPLDADALRALIEQLEDPATDLVRRDKRFGELGLTDSDVESPDQVVAVLTEHPELMQRPVLIRGDRAIIGRPKDRVAPFLA